MPWTLPALPATPNRSIQGRTEFVLVTNDFLAAMPAWGLALAAIKEPLEELVGTVEPMLDIIDEIEAVGAITAAVSTVAGISGNVTTVAGISGNVTTVAGISANVATVAGIHANVTTVAGISAAVSTVSGISANVTTLAPVAAGITTLAPIAANITAVAGISSAVSTVSGISANVTTLAPIAASITTVAGIASAVSNVSAGAAVITTVAGISGAVSTVAGISSAVTAVGTISANVTTVAGIATNVTAVANIAANVTTAAGIAANITTVAGVSAAISTLAPIAANVSAVAAIAADVSTCAANIADIQAAPDIAAALEAIAAGGNMYLTAAAMTAAVASIDANGFALVLADETDSNHAAVYQKQSGTMVQVLDLSDGVPPAWADITGKPTFSVFGLSLVDDANAAAALATLGATTVGAALFGAANPGAITFLRVNADNSVTLRSAVNFRSDVGLAIGTNVQAYDANLPTFPAGISTAEVGYLDGVTSAIQTQLDAKAPLASPGLTGNPTAPTQTAANNSTRIATTAYVDGAVGAIIAAADAMVFKGVVDCSANPNYPAADRGWTYKVSVAGKIGGASGINVEVGDTLLCITDSTASGNQATVGAQWNITQANLDGAVIGPASSVNNRVAVFSGTSGKLLADSGLLLSGSNTGDQTITLTGDVTGSGTGSFAATIAAGSVTLAKMANMATGSLIYRKSASSGAPEVQSLATLKTDLGLTGTNSGDQTYIPPRASSVSNVATTWAWNSDSYDGLAITAQAGNLSVPADAGTPTDFKKTILRIKASGADRTITFVGSTSKSFLNAAGSLLTVSGSDWTYVVPNGKTAEFGLIYDASAARHRIVGVVKDT